MGSLPAHEKNQMLAHIYETLELRVGMRLAQQMSSEQLDEFEGFMGKEAPAKARHYLATHLPDWQQRPDFLQQRQEAAAKGLPEEAATAEYAAFKWLENNFPGYKQVVAEELEKLKAEAKSQAPHILAAAQDNAAPPPNAAA